MTGAEHRGATRDIVVDEVYPHAREIVWRTMTTPELMGRWLKMIPVGFEPTVGNRFTYQTSPAGEWDGTIRCEVLEAVPQERLVYSWKGGHEGNAGYGSLLDTIVTLSLEPVASGTRLRVVHSGFVLPRNDTAYRNMSSGWSAVVSRIGAVSAEQTSGDEAGVAEGAKS